MFASPYANVVCFFLNGERVELREGECLPSLTLLEFLRKRRLTGTKLGCGQGACGSCTVALASWDAQEKKAVYRSVNSCLTPVLAVDGCHVVTVEGLGTWERPHVLQSALAAGHASQCGFCTPGFVMSLFSAAKAAKDKPTSAQIEKCFDGNLCRCTGYRPILDSAKAAVCADLAHFQDEGANRCSHAPRQLSDGTWVSSTSFEKAAALGLPKPDGDDEELATLAFPELLQHRQLVPISLGHAQCAWRWYAPRSLMGLLELAARLPGSRIYNGNTDFTQNVRTNTALPAVVSTLQVPELQGVQISEESVEIGVAAPLAFVHDALQPLEGLRGWDAVRDVRRALDAFASTQVRNWCGLGSLLLRSDLVPVLAAAGAEVVVKRLADIEGTRGIASLHYQKDVRNKPIGDNDAFHGRLTRDVHYHFDQRLIGSRACGGPLGGPSMAVEERRVGILDLELGPGEVPIVLVLSRTTSSQLVRGFRASLRRSGAFSVLAAGLRLNFEEAAGQRRIAEALLVASSFGPARRSGCFPGTAAALKGSPFPVSASSFPSLLKVFFSEAEALEPTAPTAHGHFRKALAASFLCTVLGEGPAGDGFGISRPVCTAVQSFELKASGGLHASTDHAALPEETPRAPVGLPLPHTSCLEQTTGEAVYADDLPIPGDCLWAAHVASRVAHGRIKGVDFSGALQLSGVYGYFDYRDFVTRVEEKKIPANNAYKVFTSGRATAIGHCIGITVAETPELAKQAAELVKVDFEELEPVFTVQEALEKKALHPYDHTIESGEVDRILAECRALGKKRVVEGELEIGGQEHFYLEPHAAMAVPGEGGEMIIYSCTQCVHKTQKTVAEVLGVPCHKVVVRVKRMGGAFGGKEVLSTFIAARLAVAARQLRRPVRMLLDRQEDMEVSGQRHPFKAKFSLAFADDGRILAYTVDFFANAGHTTSITKEVMDRALSHAHNAYHIENFRATGTCCDTNWYSFTAFRGFGAPQAMLVIETALEMVAAELKMPVETVRLANLLPAGGSTPYGQLVEGNVLRPMWDELWRSAEVESRRLAIESFNKNSPHQRRGLAVVPTKYGVNFPVKFLNQSGALVTVYQQDASVLVCHGGTEMGQGLNIKLAQIAAHALGCDVSLVHVGETASDKVPNSSPTAASVGSDINGMAVLDACRRIAERLKPFRTKRDGSPATWKEAVQTAYLDRVSLFSEGFYATPRCCEYNWSLKTKDNSQRGIMYAYHTFGVGCAEVEVDLRTGEWACLRADVLVDVGSSLNPAIDIGQVEGAFVQGMGMYTLEELQWAGRDIPWARPGTLLTNSPHSYKIPGASDTPCDFRVALWPGSPNARAVHSSKAVGEPPLFLSAAVFFAIKQALCSANAVPFLQMDSPATVERIRLAYKDLVVQELLAAVGDYKPPARC